MRRFFTCLAALVLVCAATLLVSSAAVPAPAPDEPPSLSPAASASFAPAPVSSGVLLDIPEILQLPELPNGCEATALAMLLNYCGYPADKLDIAYRHLPLAAFETSGRVQYGADPETAYPGDPGQDAVGYYCYPPVVLQAAKSYLAQQNGAHAARDLSGMELERLLELVKLGIPPLVWHTTDLQPPRFSEWNAWYLFGTGERFVPYSNLHVSVLRGYDAETIYLQDPLGRLSEAPRAAFRQSYEAAGLRAFALLPPAGN